MTAVANPFPLFTDNQARLIDNGRVFIGLADQDPETNPASVYWDEALTVPAAQPLQTVAGYVVNAGSPSTFYVAGPYSIRVRQPNGSVVFFRGNVTSEVSALGAGDGSAKVGFLAAGTSAASSTTQKKLRQEVSVEDFDGCDPTGATSSVAAFNAALAVARRVKGVEGSIYLLDSPVPVPSDREIVGNGGTLKIAPGATGLRLANDNCTVTGWTILGNGGLYAVQNTGKNNTFSGNVCQGNIGHFSFNSGALHAVANGNRIEGRTADTEITTAIIFESCKHITVSNNQSEDIPVGWFVQVRDGSEDFTITGNNLLQTQYNDTKVATAGQTVFTFLLERPCFLRKIQVNGLPQSSGYTVTGTNPYTVTFGVGRTGGEAVRLVGYRGAEQIQINSFSKHGTITGNVVDGTADSGIILHGSHISCTGNKIRNCGYVGIAIYGDQDNITVTGNEISDCAQMDDGMSSPDFPDLPSVFAGAILCSGNNATITGNTITNTPIIAGRGTMRYAIRFNKQDMPLLTDGRATISESGNSIRGLFVDGNRYAPQDTTGQRVKSISTDGPAISYPVQIDLDQRWGIPAPTPGDEPNYPPYPPSTAYFNVGGSGGTRATRDMATKLGGTASLRTVPGQYIDFDLLASSMLYGTNVEITFWAKANGGSSYFTVFTTLAGLSAPITATITDTNWRQYTISFPLVPNLAPSILIRMGADTESANFQHIQITGRRL
jgi:parallel beta-helix repeat protein